MKKDHSVPSPSRGEVDGVDLGRGDSHLRRRRCRINFADVVWLFNSL
jgi:hypothetical protein